MSLFDKAKAKAEELLGHAEELDGEARRLEGEAEEEQAEGTPRRDDDGLAGAR
jgi:hypothetical protein